MLTGRVNAHGRIKVGALCSQDYQFFRWPLVPNNYVDANLRFALCVGENGRVECTAPGFGMFGDYGSGSIIVLRSPDCD